MGLSISCNCILIAWQNLPNSSLERTGLSARFARVIEVSAEVSPGVGELGPPRRSARCR